MGAHAFSQKPDYIEHLERNEFVGARTVSGVAQRWNMPVALFEVRGGFDNRADPGAITHHTLKWRMSGSAVHAVTNARKSTCEGDSVCIQARESRARYWSSGDLACAHIYLPDALLRQLATEMQEERGDQPDLLYADVPFANDERLTRAAHSYFSLALQENAPCALEMDTRSIVLAAHLLLRHSVLSRRRPRKLIGQLTPAQLSKALEALASPSNSAVRLAEVARHVALSQFHFCRAFSATVGMPPHQWLIAIQIERAKRLLERPGPSIARVAKEVGYSDAGYFGRLFKAKMGMTPLAYRKQAGH